jgi:tight adherence protein B
VSVFGLIFALWAAAVTFWAIHRSRTKQKLDRRLQFDKLPDAPSEERVIRLWHDGKAVDTFVPDSMKITTFERLERARQDAGWQTPMPQILAMVATFVLISAGGAWLLSHRLVMVVALAATILMGFKTLLQKSISRRTGIFEKQLVEALDLGARSLRAGHPLSGAFKLIAQEIGAPVSIIFSDIIEQEALGVSLQRALLNASARSRSPDMKIFATSVVIQLRSGGNLADMIDRVAWVVRERMRLHRRARVLTAEAQMSKWVLLALPTGMFALLNLINPEYMDPFYDTFLGQCMMGVAIAMLLMGAWLMNRMANLKY